MIPTTVPKVAVGRRPDGTCNTLTGIMTARPDNGPHPVAVLNGPPRRLPGFGVPQPYGAVVAGGGDLAAVG